MPVCPEVDLAGISVGCFPEMTQIFLLTLNDIIDDFKITNKKYDDAFIHGETKRPPEVLVQYISIF